MAVCRVVGQGQRPLQHELLVQETLLRTVGAPGVGGASL